MVEAEYHRLSKTFYAKYCMLAHFGCDQNLLVKLTPLKFQRLDLPLRNLIWEQKQRVVVAVAVVVVVRKKTLNVSYGLVQRKQF